LKYLSVCSGIEAATVAWHPLGWEAVAYSEIEKFPSEVLAHHYPNTPNVGDMTKFKEWNLGTNVDLLVGGTPCQSFSVAGLRKGLDDPRGNLMLTYLAIAKQYRPNWLVWENVPGVLSSNGGRDFGSFLGGLAECGYGFAYRVLDAQYFGVAQRRRRVFVVGYLGDWRPAAAVLFERHSLSGHPAPSREKREDIAGTIAARFGISRNNHEELAPPKYLGNAEGGAKEVPFLTCHNTGGTAGISNQTPLVIHETVGALCADTHPGSYSGQDAYTGRLIPQPIALAENTIGRQPENGGNGDGFTDGGPMYTLNATGVHGVAQPIPLNTMTMQGRPSDDGRMGSGIGEPGDPCPTLTKAHSHAVAQPLAYNIAPGKGALKDDIHVTDADATKTLDASGSNPAMHQGGAAILQPIGVDTYNGAETGQVSCTITADVGDPTHSGPKVLQAMAVRRLTPKECERLQGFGDNYTDIQPKGKPTPDGPRYKALGNSMAVPVMAWIGERIKQYEEMA
jgi:DNA (cytosine-5)-methyltransferase 1